MPVLKNKTQGRYVNVYKSILEDRSLSLRDRGMLVTLLSLPDNWNFSIAGLAKILPDGRSSISASLNELCQKGYLTKEQARTMLGKFGGNIVEVHETPRLPLAENPSTGNPMTAKPLPENQSQLNNNRLSNNKEINKRYSPKKKNQFNDFNQREYDWENLERTLVEKSMTSGEE